jgi:membrane protease YdiL (CAAX protease family)
MKINPLTNALAVLAYILAVVGIITALQSPNTPDKGILAPMFLLSLFTLSAAVMAFLFFYQPFKLYFDNRRRDAVMYFMKTVGYLAVVVLISFSALLYFRATNSITFPRGGEKLVQGQSYELTWTGGREETIQIFLVDMSLKDAGTSASISDRIYGIENRHSYTYTVPADMKPGTYQLQIGSLTSPTFDIVPK